MTDYENERAEYIAGNVAIAGLYARLVEVNQALELLDADLQAVKLELTRAENRAEDLQRELDYANSN